MNIVEYISSIITKKNETIGKYDSLGSEKQEMIKGVFGLGETTVKEVMVPRMDTVFIDAENTEAEILKTVTESGHSRFPVYRETLDNVTGIVYVKDILKNLVTRGTGAAGFKIEDIMHKAYFIPESKHIDELFHDFQTQHVHIAVVVDEYGGVSGIISMEDILEEIVGDIQDEFDNEIPEIVKLDGNTWRADARINMGHLAEVLNESVNAGLPVEEFDTLGGFVFDLFGRIPVKGENVKYNNLSFTIDNIEGRRITAIKIQATSENGGEEKDPDDNTA